MRHLITVGPVADWPSQTRGPDQQRPAQPSTRRPYFQLDGVTVVCVLYLTRSQTDRFQPPPGRPAGVRGTAYPLRPGSTNNPDQLPITFVLPTGWLNGVLWRPCQLPDNADMADIIVRFVLRYRDI